MVFKSRLNLARRHIRTTGGIDRQEDRRTNGQTRPADRQRGNSQADRLRRQKETDRQGQEPLLKLAHLKTGQQKRGPWREFTKCRRNTAGTAVSPIF